MSNNLIGLRFGKWSVIEKTDERKGGHVVWKCLCDCGKYKNVVGNSLKSGKSKSCGCTQLQDLTNCKFGKLLALKPTEQRYTDGCIIWECLCDCGNTHYVKTTSLTSGDISSCGKCPKHNLLDKRFGILTVLKLLDIHEDNMFMWECICDCGEKINVSGAVLVSGHKKSCGCLTSEGENKIKSILDCSDISYIQEYKFSDLTSPINNKVYLRFDFAIFENDKLNYLIEYDGSQHFEQNVTNYGWNTQENFEKLSIRDKLKNDYCLKNKIPLIRIPYTKLNYVDLKTLQLETTEWIFNSQEEYIKKY